MLLGAPRVLSADEKRQALDLVLSSHTFARSDQLKAFLEYVCQQEIAGKGGDLNEYLVGVMVLGRPEGYSTGDDSTVRSRAHALRRKLQEFYSQEVPHAPVRIDLPKGSYCPRFVAKEPEAAPIASGTPQSAEPPAEPVVARRQRNLPAAWILAAAATATGLLLAGFFTGRSADPVDPVLREAWGPLLEPGANVLVCVATAPHLLIRQRHPEEMRRGLRPLPDEWALDSWYRERGSLAAGQRLYLLPHHHSPLWGDVAGAMSVLNILTIAGASYQVMPERVGEPFILRDRNVILLGRPEFSRGARLLLEGAYYRMDFDQSADDEAVWYSEPGSTQRRVQPSRRGFVHGLITVRQSEGAAPSGRRTVVISGVNSAGAQAAAEYFVSAQSLRQLRDRFRKEGYTSWPKAWQVVIEAHDFKTLPLSLSYVAHHVMER